MAFSLDAARLTENRRVCDVCGAYSSGARGSACRTCTAGTLRYLTEIQVMREKRKLARAEARAGQPR